MSSAYARHTLPSVPAHWPSRRTPSPNLISHSRAGNVKWPCAGVFAFSGIAGAAAGAQFGRMVDGKQLLFLFGLVMLAVATAMFSPRASAGDPNVRINPKIAWR